MKPLSAVTAPIIARLHAERAERLDRVAADVGRLARQNKELNDRLEAGLKPVAQTQKDRA